MTSGVPVGFSSGLYTIEATAFSDELGSYGLTVASSSSAQAPAAVRIGDEPPGKKSR